MVFARAYAHTNIALVKYWGKRAQGSAQERALNLPATGSLSLTLDRFGTDTSVTLDKDATEDRASLDGKALEGKERERISRFIDLVRADVGVETRVVVESRNDVPTAAGLASSASGFAALAVAASRAFGQNLDVTALSELARKGSGSAARSLIGGFARLERGERDDGHDCVAHAITTSPSLDLRLLVVRCAEGRKKVGSTVGMNSTMETSPYYRAWCETHASDLDTATSAIASGDFSAVGTTMEHSTLKMHASALAAQPGLWYFAPATVAVMTAVRDSREAGDVECYFTMDAGPHVKVLCRAEDAERLSERLAAIDGIFGIETAAAGPSPALLDREGTVLERL